MADFAIGFKDLFFRDEALSIETGTMPEMPISEDRLRHWLANGLLSGWAAKVSGTWRFASGIVEHAWEVHRILGRRNPPPRPEILSGYLSVAQFIEGLRLTSSRAYEIVSERAEEIGAFKYKGLWHVPGSITSDAVVTQIIRLSSTVSAGQLPHTVDAGHGNHHCSNSSSAWS